MSEVNEVVIWFKDNILPMHAFLVIGTTYGIISNELSVIIVTMVLMIRYIRTKKFLIPHVKGLNIYSFYALILVFLGFTSYPLRNIIRDAFYVFPTIELIILGYYYRKGEHDQFKICRSVIYVGACISLINIIRLLVSPSSLSNLSAIRRIMALGSYEVVMAGIVAFAASITGADYRIKHIKIIQLLLLPSIIFCFSRSVWVEFLMGCLIILLVSQKKGTLSTRTFRIVGGVLTVLLAFLLFGQYVLPDSIVTEYIDKVLHSAQEIDAKQTINSFQEATNNWRAYEMQCAITEWKDGNILQKVFGYGMGKGIYIQYIPAAWRFMEENSRIPLLHSAYHTYLVKGGIIGVVSLIWFIAAPMYDSYKRLKRGVSGNIELQLIIIGICAALMVQAYVVRGPIGQTVNVSYTMLVGWISACFWKASSL